MEPYQIALRLRKGILRPANASSVLEELVQMVRLMFPNPHDTLLFLQRGDAGRLYFSLRLHFSLSYQLLLRNGAMVWKSSFDKIQVP